MKFVVTGANGFLGWHLRARLMLLPDAEVVAIDRDDFGSAGLEWAVSNADVVMHCAGINRGSPEQLEAGNIALARRLVLALESTTVARHMAGRPEPAVVFAGSNHADDDHPGRDTPYGRGKREAGQMLLTWAKHAGQNASVADLRFCGMFGEHGRPDYNSFVANFAHAIAAGERPQISGNRELPLLHVGDAAQRMIEAARRRAHGVEAQEGTPVLISDVARTLDLFHQVYAPAGEIPELSGPLAVSLFNTLRAAMFPRGYPLRPEPHSDERGTLVEVVRNHGGTGQAFVSTTHPGCTRGNHFHLDKIERFQVLSGTGLIRLRRVLTDETVEFVVRGDEPAVIDMPTLWTHSITNIGDEPLVTFFWTNELYDPRHPDTWPCDVIDGRDLHLGEATL